MKKVSMERIVLLILTLLIAAILIFVIALVNGKIQFPLGLDDEGWRQPLSSASMNLTLPVFKNFMNDR
jgi:hypothetical protein